MPRKQGQPPQSFRILRIIPDGIIYGVICHCECRPSADATGNLFEGNLNAKRIAYLLPVLAEWPLLKV